MIAGIFADSRSVHRTLADVFRPWCMRSGFTRINSSKCAYVVEGRAGLLAFEVQCSSWGNSAHGSQFTLNAAAGQIDPKYLSGPNARILAMMPEANLREAQDIQTAVIEGHPAIGAGSVWSTGNDNWCLYYTTEHVLRWGRFLLPLLPKLLSKHALQAGFPLEALAGQDVQPSIRIHASKQRAR